MQADGGGLILPPMLIRLSQATPPDFIRKAQRPGGMILRQVYQTIAAVFFPEVVWIRTGDPMFCSFPAHPQLQQRGTDGFAADLALGQTLDKTDLGDQLEGPQAGRLAKRTRALMHQGTQPFASKVVEGSVGRERAAGLGLQRGYPQAMKGMNGIADGLIVTVQVPGDGWRMLPLGTGKKDLTTTHRKGMRRSEASQQRLPFVHSERSKNKWCLHA